MQNFTDINGILVDQDLQHVSFQCKYDICKGECCRGESDLGAPVYQEEVENWTSYISDELYDLLPDDSVEAIKKSEGLIKYNAQFYTEVKNGGDCVFLSFKHEFPACAFELLHSKDSSKFKKPVSCELFPLRSYIKRGQRTLEFKFYPECKSALSTNMNITEFLKGPIERAFGKEWYESMRLEFNKDTKL